MRVIMTLGICVATITAAVASPGHQQTASSDSLKELARARGGKVVMTSDAYLPGPSVKELASEATLIVQGTINSVMTRLSPDERLVFTDYTLTPRRIFKDVTGTATMKAPGPGVPMMFAEPGGTVRVDGLEITLDTKPRPEPPLQLGEDVVVFLVRAPEWGAFRLHFGPYGLFRVRGEKVVGANKDLELVRPMQFSTLAELVRDIESHLSRTKVAPKND